VATLAFDSARYVGARIGIFDPSGRKVGRVGHLSNQELLVISGDASLVHHVAGSVRSLPLSTSAEPGADPAAQPRGAPPLADRLQQAT
jgi:adenine-specific DNA-methyltransferase